MSARAKSRRTGAGAIGGSMSDFHVEIGHSVSFTKTVSESDVYGFAGITGEFSPNHVNKSYMEKSGYGKLMAHGALIPPPNSPM